MAYQESLEISQYLLLQEMADEEEDEEEYTLSTTVLGTMVHTVFEARARRNENRRQIRRYLVRGDLLSNPRGLTPWQKLYHTRNDRAFITTMAFDVATFELILDSGFTDLWNSNAIPRTDSSGTAPPLVGRRSLDSAGGLGLVLHYLSSTMLPVSLMQIFALIPSTVSRYLDFTLKILLETLRGMPDARICWLQGDEFRARNELITVRHPLLTSAFGSVDGLNLPVQTSSDQEIENATYNGWLSEHFISCVLAFCSQGEIIGGRINAPGSWHDSRVARPVYEKLLNDTPGDWYLVADTAFPRGTSAIDGRIKAPLKAGTRLSADPVIYTQQVAFDRQLLSYRQTAEWGMRAIQGVFGRLRVPLPIEDDKRRATILEVVLRLHNLRTRQVGINQIRTVYMPIWQEGGQERIWRDFEKMLFGEQRRNDRVTQYHNVITHDT